VTAEAAPPLSEAPRRTGLPWAKTSRRPPAKDSAEDLTRKQIRGSGLLLAGRGLSSGLKFGAEIIVVRYLATEQYGAWTYALAAVTLFRGLSSFGLNRAISRFLPLHLERGEVRDFYGVLAFVGAALLFGGALVVGAFYAFPESIGSLTGVASSEPLQLLFILIFLVPIETVDNALTGVCAAFGASRTIFVRRSLITPGMRIAVALALVLTGASVVLLAFGYLIAGAVGIAYYAWSVVRVMRRKGLLKRRFLRGIELPVRRVLSYTTPVMTADWCAVVMLSAGPLLLGYFADMSSVALYQVVVPVAALNMHVHQSFVMLFEPSAARLTARDDPKGLRELYWRSAVWVAVLTFPLFALTFTAAEPLTVLLFGQRYAAAAPILSLLALAHFVDTMAGFNAPTLRAAGEVRWLVGVNVVSAVTTVLIAAALIPRMGALGAGVGTAAGYVVYTVLKQTALRLATGVPALEPAHAAPYVAMAAVGLCCAVVRFQWSDNLWVIAPCVILGSVVVYAAARVSLSVKETFPELMRIPVLRTILR
jgi:O-antigen/teichoic acid export membrane protein